MSIPKMANAMGYIDDDLVTGAIEYKRTKKKNSWMKWGAMAACLCLVVGLAIPMLNNDNSEPMGFETVVEIKQATNNAEYLTAGSIYLPSVVQVEEPQLSKQFSAELSNHYSVVSETVFTYEDIVSFADNAKSAGWFGDYSIEVSGGKYVITNNAISNSLKMENKGGNDICTAFMQDSGLSDWLFKNGISVIESPWFTDTYNLIIDGNVFADSIVIDLNDNGSVAGCELNIKGYETTKQKLSLVGVDTALENVFFIDKDNLLTNEELYIANVQVMHINGLPMYFFTGNPVKDTNVSDKAIEGYAFAFIVVDSVASQVSTLVDSLTAE